jgi:predicted RNase H-like nuclease (RuvC/YqgF family)
MLTLPELALPHMQPMSEVESPQAPVMGELVLEPLNKALQDENEKLKKEIEIWKDREASKNNEISSKQKLVDEYMARAKSVEEEIQRAKEESQRTKAKYQRVKEEVSSLKEKEVKWTVENEFLKRRDKELRLERTAERDMFQTMISNLMNGPENRKRKRNEDETN